MNKKELIGNIAETTGVAKKDVNSCIEAFFDEVKSSLKKGERVQLIGFGTFDTSKRAEKKGRNPKTGEEIIIPERTIPKFVAGKGLKDSIK